MVPLIRQRFIDQLYCPIEKRVGSTDARQAMALRVVAHEPFERVRQGDTGLLIVTLKLVRATVMQVFQYGAGGRSTGTERMSQALGGNGIESDCRFSNRKPLRCRDTIQR